MAGVLCSPLRRSMPGFVKVLVATRLLRSWPQTCTAGHDYNACIKYIMDQFLKKNKDPENRQVRSCVPPLPHLFSVLASLWVSSERSLDCCQIYCHATCATDTSNVSFVMDSVFDVILKESQPRSADA